MPTTRKKVIKTVYKNSDEESEGGDFSDSGSEAEINENDASTDDQELSEASSENEFENDPKRTARRNKATISKPVVKNLIKKLHSAAHEVNEENLPLFTVKDLTEADKLLPSVLNLSESDSSDDESPKASTSRNTSSVTNSFIQQSGNSDSEPDTKTPYRDVWSKNIVDNSEEIAKETFLKLEKHNTMMDQLKSSALKYTATEGNKEMDVKDLLAQGEEVPSPGTVKKKKIKKQKTQESDSEVEDWEEVKDSKIPQQGLQLVVDFPDACSRKSKKLDMEMMMRRKINRVKKEYQVYMHKVHVLCWLGHGNYVSKVLNDQEVMAAALALVPSKECYPGERIDMKYVEQITTWYKDKLTLKQDKNEEKYKPKAPPLKQQLIAQMKTRTVTTKKYLVFIFVSLLRAIGLQCRVMFNFVTVPLKPPHTELCSLSTKDREAKKENETKSPEGKKSTSTAKSTKSKCQSKSKLTVPQLDGNYDSTSDSDFETIMQVDGNDDVDAKPTSTRSKRNVANKKVPTKDENKNEDDSDVSPPKRSKLSPSKSPKTSKPPEKPEDSTKRRRAAPKKDINTSGATNSETLKPEIKQIKKTSEKETEIKLKSSPSPRKTRSKVENDSKVEKPVKETKSRTNKTVTSKDKEQTTPCIVVTDTTKAITTSKYFEGVENKAPRSTRKRSQTTIVPNKKVEKPPTGKIRTRSAPGVPVETSKYFKSSEDTKSPLKKTRQRIKKEEVLEDAQRVSHKDLAKKTPTKRNDVKADLIDIIKNTVKEVSPRKCRDSDSDDDFKPSKVTPKSNARKTTKGTSKADRSKIDRRVLSSDDDTPKNRLDYWCEVFVEELEQWVAVDVIQAKVHCASGLYRRATHPVCYVVGWDNNNYLKDVTRRYVPSWNTVTRKQRAEAAWWAEATRAGRGPRSARDREEDDALDRMQLEAPLPKSIAEYKNHPLYALQRHLLKFEALHPPDAAPLGFVRGEAVYARACVHTCRSRDTWLKDAKVVRLGEKPYKVVKARPKWDKLSNRMISDLPLEVFGPWQVTQYVPPTARDGVVPRNAYGNVELFKECMLPGGTVHVKLPGLNKVAKKLGIDCAPAMTGFDFNGGYTHPVFDGFVVCEEFQQIITEAWLKDQEEQEKREVEKMEARVYGNWRRLIKGLFIRERLKAKYGFEEPPKETKKAKGPKFVAKKK